MRLFPLFADIQGRRVLVVGGGIVAERKARLLWECGAHVVVGAPNLTPWLREHVGNGQVQWRNGAFQPEWLEDAWLVIAATDDRQANQAVQQAAQARRLLVNVVDDPELSSFQVPSIVDRSPLIIAISSSGSAPVLARRLRERLESLLDHSLGALAGLAQRYRSAIRQARPQLRERRGFYDWLLDGPVSAALRRRQPDDACRVLEQALQQPQTPLEGKVILVGAGPGDPGLLTLKALRALNEADVILYDRLVSPEILALARRDAQQVYVGKSPGEDHAATQARIHDLMRDHAQAGECVVRLKGGDAFIFGRGGEELQTLRQHGIAFEVVPGITAALACAAYAGIPLTHRDHAQSVRFVTAHSGQDDGQHDWQAMARPHQTLAFYMGVGQLEWLSGQLMTHGRAPDTPCALVQNGTHADQRVLHCTLGELAQQATQHRFKAPSLLLVGEVAALGRDLHWYGEQVPAF